MKDIKTYWQLPRKMAKTLDDSAKLTVNQQMQALDSLKLKTKSKYRKWNKSEKN